MIYYKTCAPDVDIQHSCDPCDTPEGGRVRAIGLVERGFDLTVPLVRNEVQTAIEGGRIIPLPRLIGSFDGGTPVMGEGFGNEQERKLADDYVLSFRDPNYLNNTEFYESVEKKKWNLLYFTETRAHYVDADVRITAKAPVEEGLDTRVVWNAECKWRSKNKPVVADASPIIDFFNECVEISSSSSSSSSSAASSSH